MIKHVKDFAEGLTPSCESKNQKANSYNSFLAWAYKAGVALEEVEFLRKEVAYLNNVRKDFNSITLTKNWEIKELKEKLKKLSISSEARSDDNGDFITLKKSDFNVF